MALLHLKHPSSRNTPNPVFVPLFTPQTLLILSRIFPSRTENEAHRNVLLPFTAEL